jgi:predicted CxxxxCH...CXXCH cytochrome family protein
MCAECHSTGVRKNYDAANDRIATTWVEISVGCEGCHGQGSRHVGWAHDRQSRKATEPGSMAASSSHRLITHGGTVSPACCL